MAACVKLESEREALRLVRSRWGRRGWKFSPLEKIDGENDVIDSIYALKDSPLCWPDIDTGALIDGNARLLEDLEELYYRAAQPWEMFRTVLDHPKSQREFLRWPYGTFPRGIRADARYRFWELMTTTRFSVNATPSIHELQQVNWPTPPLTERHAASLAAMVCLVDAIEALEDICSSWRTDSRRYREGMPFEWLAIHAPERLALTLHNVHGEAQGRLFYSEQVRDAWRSRQQAEAWLALLDTLDWHEAELQNSMDNDLRLRQAQLSERNRKAATWPRGAGQKVTPEEVAKFFSAHSGKYETKREECATLYGVSVATIDRRYAFAKKKNLPS